MSAPHPGDIYARCNGRADELCSLYPNLFRGPFISCSWPSGWHQLVREACEHLRVHAPHVRWSQIKEKYGELKLYYSPMSVEADANFRERLKRLEDASLGTCVLCGVYGVDAEGGPVAELLDFDGWWLSACASCSPLISAHRKTRWPGGAE